MTILEAIALEPVLLVLLGAVIVLLGQGVFVTLLQRLTAQRPQLRQPGNELPSNNTSPEKAKPELPTRISRIGG